MASSFKIANGLLTLALLLIVFGVGVWAMWKNVRVRIAALVLAIPSLAAWVVDAIDPSGTAVKALLIFSVLFFSLAIVRVLRRVLLITTVNEDSLYGAGSVYLMIGLLYSMLYYVLWKNVAQAFYAGVPLAAAKLTGWHDFVYFSFTTLATVGYGDVTPVGGLARSLAILEVITGVFFVAVIIARLVTSYRR